MSAATDALRALRDCMQQVVAAVEQCCDDLLDAAREDYEAGQTEGDNAFRTVQSRTQAALADARPPMLGMGFIGNSEVLRPGAVHWWYRPVGGRPSEPLITSAHPTLTDYYDFQGASWWQDAAQDDAFHLTGPYVDVTGTNAYIVTGSRSLTVDGTFVGVVAADLEIGELQRLWQQQLLAAGRSTSVVDADGSVIATNSGALLGACIDLDDLPAGRTKRVTGTPWAIVQA